MPDASVTPIDRDQPIDRDKHIADLQAVLEVSRELSVTDDLAHLVRSVERAACKVLECERATLLLYHRRNDSLVRPEEAGDCPQHGAQMDLAREVVETGQRIDLDAPNEDPRFDGDVDCQCGLSTRNMSLFPLLDIDNEIVGVLQVQNLPPLDPWDDELIKVFDSQVGVAVQRHRLLEHYAEKRRIQQDLKLARSIQQGLLPDSNPSLEGFDVAGWNDPADDTGGDFWDHKQLPGGVLAVSLADATGHGVGAALMMAACRSLLRASTSISRDLNEIVDRVNRLLQEDLTDSRSVTAVLGFLEGDTFSFLSAGHGPIIRYVAAEDAFHTQPAHGIPLGILSEYDWPPAEHFEMAPGDLMVLVTDGFYEWMNAEQEEFGIERMMDSLRRCRDCSAEDIIRSMHQAVLDFAGDEPQNDDLTALIIRKL